MVIRLDFEYVDHELLIAKLTGKCLLVLLPIYKSVYAKTTVRVCVN